MAVRRFLKRQMWRVGEFFGWFGGAFYYLSDLFYAVANFFYDLAT